ncbi:MAG: zonular occludens toxin domain-containing protein, partial [Planctomycetota bacterium]
MTKQFEVLRHVDFDWVVRLDDVWTDDIADVPDLQREIREEFDGKLRQLGERSDTGSPLGWVLIGTGGSGKTHLLNAFRSMAVTRRVAFVLIDMTDVRDFWDTVLQGYIDSLQMPYRDGEFQYRCLLHDFLDSLPRRQQTRHVMSLLAQRQSRQLVADINMLLKTLAREHRAETLKYQDVVRAIVCLNSDDFGISNLGMSWLQGQEIDVEDQRLWKFRHAQESATFIVEALSWLMSLAGPTVVAFDQLDPLVQQLKYRSQAEEAANLDEDDARSLAILLEVAGGLMALVDKTRKTQVILSCIESTWDKLAELAMSPVAARFEPPTRLATSARADLLQQLVDDRMAKACRQLGYQRPYRTWPFQAEIFNTWIDDTPREVLQKCDHHRRRCLKTGKIQELGPTSEPTPASPNNEPEKSLSHLGERFAQLRGEADPDYLLAEKYEDERIAPLLCSGLRCYLMENPPPDNEDAILEVQFPGGKKSVPLHGRLRRVYHTESGREDHFCVRALQHTHAKAYQSRLNAAITLSGIDRALPYRHLVVVRRGPIPGGTVTAKLTRKFQDSGGVFTEPSDEDLRTLFALDAMQREADDAFPAWLAATKTASRIKLITDILFTSPAPGNQDMGAASKPEPATVHEKPESFSTQPNPPARVDGRPTDAATSAGDATNSGLGTTTEPGKAAGKEHDEAPSESGELEQPADGDWLPLGSRLVAGQRRDLFQLPSHELERHAVVLAGAGSGKTVFLRRLVEEAALRGVPSVVIDCANDLATFDAKWPNQPAGWLDTDAQRAEQFHRSTDMVVWTPGRDDGNPLTLQPIPDLAAVAENPQDLTVAIDMVSNALREVVAAGQTAKAKKKHGLLVASLRYFARLGGGGLSHYIELLNDLPLDAGLGVEGEAKLAREMADRLRVEVETNPLLRTAGTNLDPATLFGDEGQRERTRISVINFVGLPGTEPQRHFLNQLAMLLFSWIKKHPNPPGRCLRGLLIIDEARDFVPAQKASICKESLIQLTAQARKYHLGIVFATQNPKDIDNKIVGNCSTHVYGKANAPAAIDVIREQMQLKGGGGDDIPRLAAGQFYMYNAQLNLPAPVKVVVPMCLSQH